MVATAPHVTGQNGSKRAGSHACSKKGVFSRGARVVLFTIRVYFVSQWPCLLQMGYIQHLR